jgi:hypothetical protein
MNDYQMPLFDRYDLSIEFERHLRPMRQRLVEDWDRYSFMSDDENGPGRRPHDTVRRLLERR